MFVLFFIIAPNFKVRAQVSGDYSIQANIIYHFTKYIDWPKNNKEGDFIIGVVGDSPLYDELKKMMNNKSAGNQRIVVKHSTSSQADYDCHILFIAEDQSGTIKRIAAKTAGTPVLLVSEEEGMATKGACINFIVEADRLKLEINKNNIEQRHLNIASELLHLGRIVY